MGGGRGCCLQRYTWTVTGGGEGVLSTALYLDCDWVGGEGVLSTALYLDCDWGGGGVVYSVIPGL